jgi:predicted dehydrogenase
MMSADFAPDPSPLSFRGATEVRIAFIGCGAVVERLHAPAVEVLAARMPVRVVAAVDTDPARREAMAARFKGCHAVDNLARLPEGIELALVASPSGLHAAHTIELVGRGIHVLCEKPMATSYEDCERMVEAAKSSGRLLAVGHMRRFFPVSQQIRSLIRDRALGRAISYRVVEGIRYQWSAASDANFRRDTGGGVLLDIGVHVLDLASWWFGEPSAVDYRDDAIGGVEANARIELGYPDDLVGKIVISRDWNLRQQCFFQFENGWVSFVPYASNRLEISLSPGIVLDSTLHQEWRPGNRPRAGRQGATFQQAFVHQLANVVQAITSGEPLIVPGDEGAKAMHLIERCRQSRQLMDMPWMSEAELSAARALHR